MKTKEEHITEIMDWFDFGKVAKVMKYLDWGWKFDGVPEEPLIRETARECLSYVYDKGVEYFACGGFVVEYNKKYDQMSLSFVVSDWRTNEY